MVVVVGWSFHRRGPQLVAAGLWLALTRAAAAWTRRSRLGYHRPVWFGAGFLAFSVPSRPSEKKWKKMTFWGGRARGLLREPCPGMVLLLLHPCNLGEP